MNFVFIMSQSRCFSLIGDSNVQRNVSKTSFRACPLSKAAQIIPCGNLEIFSESLQKVRAETSVCIVACLTNFFTSADASTSSSVSGRIEPVLTRIAEALWAVCEENPNRHYIISSPMYRYRDLWLISN